MKSLENMSLPASMRPKTQAIDKRLTDLAAQVLFRRMVLRAENVPEYDAVFSKWLKSGATIDLRKVVEQFGDYWRSLEFQNTVDEIDTQLAKVDQPDRNPAAIAEATGRAA